MIQINAENLTDGDAYYIASYGPNGLIEKCEVYIARKNPLYCGSMM